jgi:hypothetical protein
MDASSMPQAVAAMGRADHPALSHPVDTLRNHERSTDARGAARHRSALLVHVQRQTGRPGRKASARGDANSNMSARRSPPVRVTEADRVSRWRRRRLLDAGFAPGPAAELARQPELDLHALLDLVDRGCPPGLAARILAPLEGDAR